MLRFSKKWLPAAAGCFCAAAVFGVDENPVRTVKPLETSEAKLGDQLHKTSDSLRDLLDELQQNMGVELKSKDAVKDATGKLDVISKKNIQDVIDSLQATRKGSVQAKDGLVTA